MPRILLRAVMFALSGTALSTLLAFMMHLVQPNLARWATRIELSDATWQRIRPADCDEAQVLFRGATWWKEYRQASKDTTSPDASSPVILVVHIFQAGFPARAFEGWSIYTPNRTPRTHDVGLLSVDRLPITIPLTIAKESVVPISPMWSGLFINAAVWGAGLWLVAAGASRVRAWHRERRGLCVRCGYEVKGLPVCPECGPGALEVSCP